MTKRMTWQKRPGDEYLLQLLSAELRINKAEVQRLALREYAYTHGHALPEAVDLLWSLREVCTALRLARIQGAAPLIRRLERALKKHEARLSVAGRFRPYPRHIETELLQEQQRLTRETVSRRKKKEKQNGF